MKKKTLKWILIVIFMMVLSVLYGCQKSDFYDSDGMYLPESTDQDRPMDETESVTEDEAVEVIVYVCGHVNVPGVYALPESARVIDAVEAAGGLDSAAAADRFNLAAPVHDGEQIYIPSEDEIGQQTADPGDGRVNINTAGADLLKTLPGIGASKADSIVAYREEHGYFETIEALMRVPGIKDGVYERIEDLITVD